MEKTIKNFKAFDFLFYAPPGSQAWKHLRLVRIAYLLIATMNNIGWSFAFLFLDKTQLAQSEIEFIAVACILISLGFPILLSNLDTVLLRLKSTVFLVDLSSYLVVSILLLTYGEGFYIFGAVYLAGPFAGSYAVEGVEVDGRMNSQKESVWSHIVKYTGYFGLVTCLITIRASVFVKQVTVTDTVILVEVSDGAALTLRDFWEFWVDVLVVRLLSISFTRMVQPGRSISLGTAYAEPEQQAT